VEPKWQVSHYPLTRNKVLVVHWPPLHALPLPVVRAATTPDRSRSVSRAFFKNALTPSAQRSTVPYHAPPRPLTARLTLWLLGDLRDPAADVQTRIPLEAPGVRIVYPCQCHGFSAATTPRCAGAASTRMTATGVPCPCARALTARQLVQDPSVLRATPIGHRGAARPSATDPPCGARHVW
jgi:hypothetical protein